MKRSDGFDSRAIFCSSLKSITKEGGINYNHVCYRGISNSNSFSVSQYVRF